jgi:cytochrome c
MRTAGTIRRAGAACSVVAATLTGCLPAGSGPGSAAVEGPLLLEQYGCGTCHVIPGVRRANGRLGPALASFARHPYIAGEIPNHPETLVQWIQHPSALVPDTLMPDQAVREAHARAMGAYLMTLR